MIVSYVLLFVVQNCGDYTLPTGYVFVPNKCDNHTFGSRCDLNCDVGYAGIPIDPVCRSDGTWSTAKNCICMCMYFIDITYSA